MSDIDRTRMIPLHIADQAVAACDAEIAKLREENAALKAEVERLTKHDDDTCRHFIMRTLLEAQNGFLKARVERLERTEERLHNTLNRYALDDMRLQAHIERLTKAGNNLVYVVTDHPVAEPFVKAWNAAKEGKTDA
jgi:cell division protein FtsB